MSVYRFYLQIGLFLYLSSHMLLYLPLVETTLIGNESLVYQWKVQQHMRQQNKVIVDMMWVNFIQCELNVVKCAAM
jgi:hypothetical protein